MSNLVVETFEDQLRDCLTHLYDYAFLQNHPLLRQLIPASTGDARRVQAFRNLVTDGIEDLKPEPETDSFSKQTRFYSILVLRYLKQQSVQQVVNGLHLGERQFYRDHNKALRSLSQMLWEHAKGMQPVLDNNISIQTEIQRIHTQTRPEQIEVKAFLQKCLDAIQALTDRHQARFQIPLASQHIVLASDSGILRQTIIWIVSQLIVESMPGSRFTLAFESRSDESEFAFRRDALGQGEQPLKFSPEQQGTLNNLIQALGGRLDEFNQPGEYYQVNLTIPMKQHFVLVIYDNPDAVAIFRSYLMEYPYQVLMACDGNTALQLARDSSPELIILDLMLPQQDGWEILRTLKTHPATEQIPVLICSVLETAELAQVLGANGFLRKPPGEAEFLNVLNHLKHTGI
jgi:CheY-like chemotaxis protein